MKKMERLVGIIYALQENKKLTAKEISDIFEVSERTIYRDIDALSQLNVPIKAFEGYSGGYEIDEKYFVPSIAFNENEILYLLICLKLGEIIKVPNMQEDYKSLRYKLLNILDADTKEKHMKLLSRILFDINKIHISDYEQGVIKNLIESFLQYRDLIIEYYTPKKDECLKRRITPYTLCFDNGGWYVTAFCHLRRARRVFRIDRIKGIEISEDTNSPSVIEEYIKNIYKKEDTYMVVLEMDKLLYETMKNDDIFIGAEKKLYGDKVELKIAANSLDSIIDLAIWNSEQVKIMEPKECIDKLKEMCQKILMKY